MHLTRQYLNFVLPMKQPILSIIFVLISGSSWAQHFNFSGYVLNEDSLPVENAVLINYRTVRAFTTDQDGFFCLSALEGDSFKINHISYAHKVVLSNPFPADSNKIILLDEPNLIGEVDVVYHHQDMINFMNNMKLINEQLKENKPAPPSSKGPVYNTYYFGKREEFFNLNLFDLLNWIERKKKQ